MNSEELDKLEALCRAATPGLWTCIRNTWYDGMRLGQHELIGPKFNYSPDINEEEPKDAAYICAANPQTILRLVAQLRKASMLVRVLEQFDHNPLARDALKAWREGGGE